MPDTQEVLQQHATRLEDHSRQLQALKTELVHQRETLSNVINTLQSMQTQATANATALAAQTVSLDNIKDLLDRDVSFKNKIILILIGALIVLAGVTKLADLGII